VPEYDVFVTEYRTRHGRVRVTADSPSLGVQQVEAALRDAGPKPEITWDDRPGYGTCHVAINRQAGTIEEVRY